MLFKHTARGNRSNLLSTNDMPPLRCAVIDIGTNSVKLLVADVDGREVVPLFEASKQTRLGEGFYSTHRLQPGPITRTADAVAVFDAKARELSASVRVIATSAVRDAVNPAELTTVIQEESGLNVEVISGDQEAEWAFVGVTTDPALRSSPLLILDVGGGSTEVIVGREEQVRFRCSLPLGTVRLLATTSPSDPPTPAELDACSDYIRQFFKAQLQPQLTGVLKGGADSLGSAIQVVATGGSASILGCMEAQLTAFDRERLESVRLSRQRLQWHLNRLWSLALEQRKQIVGLPPNRADVILMGVAIYDGFLQQLGLPDVRISTRGLRFGAVSKMNCPPC